MTYKFDDAEVVGPALAKAILVPSGGVTESRTVSPTVNEVDDGVTVTEPTGLVGGGGGGSAHAV